MANPARRRSHRCQQARSRTAHRHVEVMVLKLGPPFELLHRALDGPSEEREILAPAHLHLAVAAAAAAVVAHALGDVRSFAAPLASANQSEAGVAHDEAHALSATGCPGSDTAKTLSLTAQSMSMMSGAYSSAHIAQALCSVACALRISSMVLRPSGLVSWNKVFDVKLVMTPRQYSRLPSPRL